MESATSSTVQRPSITNSSSARMRGTSRRELRREASALRPAARLVQLEQCESHACNVAISPGTACCLARFGFHDGCSDFQVECLATKVRSAMSNCAGSSRKAEWPPSKNRTSCCGAESAARFDRLQAMSLSPLTRRRAPTCDLRGEMAEIAPGRRSSPGSRMQARCRAGPMISPRRLEAAGAGSTRRRSSGGTCAGPCAAFARAKELAIRRQTNAMKLTRWKNRQDR
jgi:hypothetical protein